ncbi:MAG: hypothetical protein EXR27_04035 [Betaproteobacteria bacterium]|nr:hypothetical protein [Betaproteobacteria bacterium]
MIGEMRCCFDDAPDSGTHGKHVTRGRAVLLAAALVLGPVSAQVLPDLLPDSRPGAGRNDIALAWLAAPTTRYAHGVLGDAIEAAALRVRLREGAELRYDLPSDSVFEDLQPRVLDLDGDGRDEIMVVRSRLDAGATAGATGSGCERKSLCAPVHELYGHAIGRFHVGNPRCRIEIGGWQREAHALFL